MSADYLDNLSFEDLLDLMAKSIAELIAAKKKDVDYKLIASKKQQVDILQKAIVEKSAEQKPGYQIKRRSS